MIVCAYNLIMLGDFLLFLSFIISTPCVNAIFFHIPKLPKLNRGIKTDVEIIPGPSIDCKLLIFILFLYPSPPSTLFI